MLKKLAYLLVLTFAITTFAPSVEAAVKSKHAVVKTSKKGKKHHKKRHHKGKSKRHKKA